MALFRNYAHRRCGCRRIGQQAFLISASISPVFFVRVSMFTKICKRLHDPLYTKRTHVHEVFVFKCRPI